MHGRAVFFASGQQTGSYVDGSEATVFETAQAAETGCLFCCTYEGSGITPFEPLYRGRDPGYFFFLFRFDLVGLACRCSFFQSFAVCRTKRDPATEMTSFVPGFQPSSCRILAGIVTSPCALTVRTNGSFMFSSPVLALVAPLHERCG